MKSLKTILGIALSLGGLGTTAAVVGVSAAESNKAVVDSEVAAATSTTVYYAVTTTYTVKCNVHFGSNESDPWGTYTMSKVNDVTFNGKDVYSCTFTDSWDGLATMQLQKYDGSTFKEQEVAISSWTGVSNYNGKIWDGSWKTYAPDLHSVTLSVSFDSDVPSYVDIYIPGGFNSWSTDPSVSKMTRSTDRVFTYSLTNVAQGYVEYLICACYSNASYMDYDHKVTSSNQNITFISSDEGVTKSLGTKTYNFTSNFPVYSPTVTVTFSASVPEYVDIYLPGDFNGWSTDKSVSKMTRTSSTTFTYSISNAAPNTYYYKVVACYSSASEMDYTHEVDTSNQSMTISSNSGIGLNKSYDWSKMPQETIPDGTTVTLTFTNAIPNTVDIIYVGGLTNWGTTPARISAGIMSTNAQRKVFTWNIPNGTYTGSYKYKIVAMSAYTTADKVSYDHIVYGVKDSDETMVLDKTTTNYPLTGLEIDLTELAAYSFSEGFNTAMAGPCSDPNANNKSAVSAIWSTWKSTFEGMPGEAKTEFGTNQGEMITQARSTYLHCVRRYNLATWTGAPSASSSAPLNIINAGSNNTAVLAILITSIVALSAAGVFFILRKKKFER